MGVKSCSRNNCHSIMCDTYIVGGIGYVCNDCQDEFKKMYSEDGVSLDTELEIRTELENFMKISKLDFDIDKKMTIDEFFNNHTK